MLTPTQIKQRRNTIGGSDVYDIIFNPQQKFYEKMGILEKNLDDVKDIQRGNTFEHEAGWFYQKKKKRTVRKPKEQFVHFDYPFLVGNADREFELNGKMGILELKCPRTKTMNNVRVLGAKDAHICQLQFYLMVTERSIGAIGYFDVMEMDMLEWDMFPDVHLQEQILDRCLWFYDYLKKEECPPNSPKFKIDIPVLRDDKIQHIDDEEFVKLTTEFDLASKEKNDSEKRYKEIKVKLKKFFNESKVVESGGSVATLSTGNTRKTYDLLKLKHEHKDINLDDYIKESEPFDRISVRKL